MTVAFPGVVATVYMVTIVVVAGFVAVVAVFFAVDARVVIAESVLGLIRDGHPGVGGGIARVDVPGHAQISQGGGWYCWGDFPSR